MIIAIDGPAGAGKGTLARELARVFRLKYLDTGTLYRAVTHLALIHGLNPQNEAEALKAVDLMQGYDFKHVGNNVFGAFLNEEDITRALRRPEVNAQVSYVAAHPLVREALKEFQVGFATHWGAQIGVIMDGRDIGTVICPFADFKFFLDASPEVRAQRRLKELNERGFEADFEACLAEVKRRDTIDRNREVAPLKPADDAIIIDSSTLDADAVIAKAIDVIGREKLKTAVS